MWAKTHHSLTKAVARLTATMLVLACFAGVLVTPRISHAQFVPPVPKPTMVAMPCPYCGKWIKTPNGRMPMPECKCGRPKMSGNLPITALTAVCCVGDSRLKAR